MSRRKSARSEDDSKEIVARYEAFMSNRGSSGYFEVEEMENIVDYYLQKGHTIESSKALEFAFRLHPNNLNLLSKRAKIYLATGDHHKAYKILESLGSQADYETNLLKIDALIRLERDKEAYMLAHQLIEEETAYKDVVCLDITYLYLTQYDILTAKEFVILGEKYNPFNEELLFELAFCYEHTEEGEKAITTYERIIKLNAYSAEAWFNLGQIFFMREQLTQALEAYEYARVIQPEDTLTCMQKAHVHFQLQHYTEALEEYIEYQEMTGKNWQTNYFIGECHERMGNCTEALKYYFEAIKDNQENFDILAGIAVCLIDGELYEESLPYIDRALILNEKSPEAWVYMADAQLGLNNIDQALSAYLISIKLDEDQPDTLMAIANILMEQGEYTYALGYYKQALIKDEHQELENIYLFIAVAHHFLGETEASQEALEFAMHENLDALKLFNELCYGK